MRLAGAWNGGVYYAAQRRQATAAEKLTTGSLALLYFSKWKTSEAANTFDKLYEAELGRKYNKLMERKSDEAEGEKVYTSEEGDVLLWRQESAFFVSEGLPLATARKLRDETVAAQGVGPVKLASAWSVRGRELALGSMAGVMQMGVWRGERYTREAVQGSAGR